MKLTSGIFWRAYANEIDLGYIRRELETFTEADDPRRAKFESWAIQSLE